MNPGTSTKKWAVLVIAVLGALIAWFSQRDAGTSPSVVHADTAGKAAPAGKPAKPKPQSKPASHASAAAFDFYLLALTVHPAFCADGHQRKGECRAAGQRPLVIHGLWPEKLEPKAYPRDCPAPALNLEPALVMELEDFMPGMADNLHQHEWRTHGGCSGMDDDAYFRRTLELTRDVDASLRAKLTTLAGRTTTADELREVADLFHPGLGATLTFHCRTLRDAPQAKQPYLIEVRQCVDDDGAQGAPGTLLDCGKVNRRDQGCGRNFWIAAARQR